MTEVETRRRSPLTVVAGVGALIGAALLIIAPWPPMARVEVFSESVDVRPPAVEGWGIVATGLVAVVLAVLTLVRRNSLWASLVVLPGLVAIGWSARWVFVKLPDMAQFADAASIGLGGVAFVLSGPILIASSLLAFLAARFGRNVD
jgi:hypothetical protein